MAIVKSLIRLADNLGIHAVAEGIESTEQARLLRKLGCRYGQGYAIARPMSAEEFSRWWQTGIKSDIIH